MKTFCRDTALPYTSESLESLMEMACSENRHVWTKITRLLKSRELYALINSCKFFRDLARLEYKEIRLKEAKRIVARLEKAFIERWRERIFQNPNQHLRLPPESRLSLPPTGWGWRALNWLTNRYKAPGPLTNRRIEKDILVLRAQIVKSSNSLKLLCDRDFDIAVIMEAKFGTLPGKYSKERIDVTMATITPYSHWMTILQV